MQDLNLVLLSAAACMNERQYSVLSSVLPLTASKVPVSVLMLSIAVSRVYPAGSRIHSGFRDDLPYQAAVCATTRNQIKEFKVSIIINVHMPKH